jgi:V/A-type H+/Na+-transporting ATPase subunit I
MTPDRKTPGLAGLRWNKGPPAMPLRPAQTRWFETYLPRSRTVDGVRVLAATGAVALETRPAPLAATDAARLRFFVDRFRQQAQAHARDLPPIGAQATALEGDPVHLANQALHRLRLWRDGVDQARARLAQLDAEIHYLHLLDACLTALAGEGLDLERALGRSRFLCKCLFACPRQEGAPPLDLGVETLARGQRWDFLYVASLPEQRHLIRRLAVERGCEQIALPAWLAGPPDAQRQALDTRLADARRQRAHYRSVLRTHRQDAGMAQARADMETLGWYLDHAADTLGTGPLNRVSGWTSAPPGQLRQALAASGIQAILRSPLPPAGTVPVTVSANWWSAPFRPLVEMMGAPGHQEVDPSALLALVVPLLFGYMFPDVGHGLILALLALTLARRWPQVRFLIPCGLAAMGFGLLTGEVFGLHGILPALAASPLDAPLTVLIVPLTFGALLLLLGMGLAGLQARWRGEGRRWLWKDGALALLYAALLASLFYPPALLVAVLAGFQYLGASLNQAVPGRAGSQHLAYLPAALGELALGLFELALNTLSFLRVGAFALGHAARSQAVVTLAEGTGCIWGWWTVMVLGNLFALTL